MQPLTPVDARYYSMFHQGCDNRRHSAQRPPVAGHGKTTLADRNVVGEDPVGEMGYLTVKLIVTVGPAVPVAFAPV